MRVGINATSLNDRPSGARQRLIGIYGALFRSRPDNEYVIFEPRDCRVADWFGDCPNVRGVPTGLPSVSRWGRFFGGIGLWNRLLAKEGLDCFEALHLPLIVAPCCPTLLTIHDARPVLPDVPRLKRTIYRQVLRTALRRADAVITVSDTMRAELLRLEPAARITTIYNGIDATPFAGTGQAAKPSGEHPFLLAVGHFEARKNYATLLHAFREIADRGDAPDLIIIGKDGGELAAIRALVVALGLSGRVSLLHDVDDLSLAAHYRAASLLVFPSTYEGFGIPILEAMAAGTPMALSDLPVFRELTQDRAAYFDPRDAKAMATVILDLLGSPTRLAEQCAYGRERLTDFAFEKLAAQLDALHQKATAQTGRPAG